MKRISTDKAKSVTYLFDDVAVLRTHVENAVVTLTGTSEGTYYELVKAHWLNKPTLSSETGDEIICTLVGNIESIYYDVTKKIVCGVGVVAQDVRANKLSEGRTTYFLLYAGNVSSFTDRQKLDIFLQDVDITIGYLLDPATLFPP
jgi:hypothetical protein